MVAPMAASDATWERFDATVLPRMLWRMKQGRRTLRRSLVTPESIALSMTFPLRRATPISTIKYTGNAAMRTLRMWSIIWWG